jgi:hypothetical protein
VTLVCDWQSRDIFAGELIRLEEFQEVYMKPYVLSKQEYHKQCKVDFDHSSPAPGTAVGGSAVQGL